MFFLRSPERRQYQLLSDQRRHSAPDSFRFLKLPMLEPLVESRRLKENQRQDNSLLSPRSPGGSHPFGVPNGPTGKCLSQNVFLKMYFSKCISQNVFLKMYLVCQMDQQESVFLKMYFSKCIFQNVFLKMYFSKCIFQNVFLKMYLVCQMDLQESQLTLPATFNLPQEEPFLVQRYN